MKNVLFLLILAAVVTLGCKKDEQIEITLRVETENVQLDVDQTHRVVIIEGSSTPSFKCNNLFVAEVDNNGLIEALRVGEAKITVTSLDGSATVNLVVSPRHTYWRDPVLSWGKSKSFIIEKWGVPTEQTEKALLYEDENSNIIAYMYLFNDNGELTSSSLLMKSNMYEAMIQHLRQRFNYLGIHSGVALFIDALTMEDATTFAGIDDYNSEYKIIAYGPTTDISYVKAIEVVSNSLKELKKCQAYVAGFE